MVYQKVKKLMANFAVRFFVSCTRKYHIEELSPVVTVYYFRAGLEFEASIKQSNVSYPDSHIKYKCQHLITKCNNDYF